MTFFDWKKTLALEGVEVKKRGRTFTCQDFFLHAHIGRLELQQPPPPSFVIVMSVFLFLYKHHAEKKGGGDQGDCNLIDS